MSELRIMVEDMSKGIEMARHYYESALFYKDVNMDFARKFADMAKQQINNVTALHEMAVSCIKKAEEKGAEATEHMKQKWHEAHVDMMDEIRELEYKIGRI